MTAKIPQEELQQLNVSPTDEFAVNRYMQLIGFKWDDTREWWYNDDNVTMYQKAATHLYQRIEAEATRRELALLDELEKECEEKVGTKNLPLSSAEHGFNMATQDIRKAIAAKRQALKKGAE